MHNKYFFIIITAFKLNEFAKVRIFYHMLTIGKSLFKLFHFISYRSIKTIISLDESVCYFKKAYPNRPSGQS